MNPTVVSRAAIIDALRRSLEPLETVRAAWLGGSDATGRTDRWSDVDLQAVVVEGTVESAFDAVHAALERLSPIAHRYRLPSPTWHGHQQEFLSLRDADPAHFVDLVLIERGTREWFLEEERHGRAIVLFDKDALVVPPPFDRAAHEVRIARRLEVLRETFPLFQTLVTRAVAREQWADAAAAYAAYTLRPLIELLRMRWSADRFDYGPRYLDRDLPEDLRMQIDRLAIPGSGPAIEAFRREAQALWEATLADLDAGRWTVPSRAATVRGE